MNLLERFASSAVGRKLAAAQEAEDLAARRQLADRLQAVAATMEQERRRLTTALEMRRAEEEHARMLLQEATTAVHRAERAKAERLAPLEHEHSTIRGELRASASPHVEAFRRELQTLEGESRAALVVDVQESENRLGVKIRRVYSNAPSIDARLAAIRGARTTLDELELLPLAEVDVLQQIEQLRVGLPAVVASQDEQLP